MQKKKQAQKAHTKHKMRENLWVWAWVRVRAQVRPTSVMLHDKYFEIYCLPRWQA